MFGLSTLWLSDVQRKRKRWQDTTSCRLDRFEDPTSVLINSPSVGWGECRGFLSMHKSRQSSTGAQEAKRICQVCCSWNIITYRLKVTASLHMENVCCGVKELGSQPVPPPHLLQSNKQSKLTENGCSAPVAQPDLTLAKHPVMWWNVKIFLCILRTPASHLLHNHSLMSV